MKLLTFAGNSHPGLVREENQDCFGKFPPDSVDLSTPKGQLFIVADGMGGHKAGRMASDMAVKILSEEYFAAQVPTIEKSLGHAFRVANQRIHNLGHSGREYVGMGTTCIALVLQNSHAFIGHIGDSRIYRITQEEITQLTHDHSKVAEMVRDGILTEEEAQNHPQRSYLTRALGAKPVAEIDYLDEVLLDGEIYYLLCTDGLYHYVLTAEMQRIVLSYPPQQACKELVRIANERGGQDNITVQIIVLSDE
ncbi:MAG: Stp1/IreP family PP2C-type Ser/Thr phosphatase [Ignavibacteriae bacterium]|nr:Stp1/IreP family PP2C-type Ser/Thr phosphatase [Ignavibacteriota bacterium]